MRGLGVHQGLAPVLDVARDLRWGRVEETIGEDPVSRRHDRQRLRSRAASRPASSPPSSTSSATPPRAAGATWRRSRSAPRELADVMLPPFEMALRAGARSVMNSYTDIDGVPVAADAGAAHRPAARHATASPAPSSPTTSPSPFLQTLHGVAADAGEAAAPGAGGRHRRRAAHVNCYGAPLLAGARGRRGRRRPGRPRVERVLLQKCELGLLDATGRPSRRRSPSTDRPDLDDGDAAALARARAGTRSIVLLRNDGALPLRAGPRLAVVGPRARHVAARCSAATRSRCTSACTTPDVPHRHRGRRPCSTRCAPTGGYDVHYAAGLRASSAATDDGDRRGGPRSPARPTSASPCSATRPGLFGRGTSGEGCDAADLRLPGRQEELLEALLATGTPVVLVLLVGRPYELSRQADRLAAVVCGVLPRRGGRAARSPTCCPAGSTRPGGCRSASPAAGASQPSTYLAPRARAAQRGQHRRPDARCSRSATGCPTRR